VHFQPEDVCWNPNFPAGTRKIGENWDIFGKNWKQMVMGACQMLFLGGGGQCINLLMIEHNSSIWFSNTFSHMSFSVKNGRFWPVDVPRKSTSTEYYFCWRVPRKSAH
jgi:hypothetical protein